MLPSIAMGFTWVAVVCLGVATLALAAAMGHDYAFTAPGISRMGPRLGRRIPATTFTYRGELLSLRRMSVRDRPTLLVFVDGLAKDADKPHVKDILIPDLLRFARLFAGRVRLVVFCTEPCTKIEHMLQTDDSVTVVGLPNDDLTNKLAIRAMPFSVLLDRHGRVIDKGLSNHFEHLCLIVARARAGGDVSQTDEMRDLAQTCQMYVAPAR